MCVFLISPVPIAEPLTSELIDTPVFYNLAPRPIKYRVSVPIPSQDHTMLLQVKSLLVYCHSSNMVAQNVVTRSAGQITAWEENILQILLVWTHMLQYPICDVWTGFKENLFVFRSWPVLTWCYKLPAPLYEWIAMNESTNCMSVNLPQMAHIVSVGYFNLCLGLTWRVGNFLDAL